MNNDFYKVLFNISDTSDVKTGGFITKDGRIIFIGGPSSGGGSAASAFDNSFINSPVYETLDALRDNFDFVIFGSTAARMLAGEDFGRLPNDIDVLDLQQNTEKIAERFEVYQDPRGAANRFGVLDKQTGVEIDALSSGIEISGFRTPTINDVAGNPNFIELGGFKVIKPAILAEQLYYRGNYDDLEGLIRGANLPQDFIPSRWYQLVWSDAQGGKSND